MTHLTTTGLTSIALIFSFDSVLLWFSVIEQTVTFFLAAFLGMVFHWPQFMVTMNFSTMTRSEKLWLLAAIDINIIGLIYIISTSSYILAIWYIAASCLTLVIRRNIVIPFTNFGGVKA